MEIDTSNKYWSKVQSHSCSSCTYNKQILLNISFHMKKKKTVHSADTFQIIFIEEEAKKSLYMLLNLVEMQLKIEVTKQATICLLH